MVSNTHESHIGGQNVKMGSERSFGLVFASVFLLISLWNFFQAWPDWRESIMGKGALAGAVLFAVMALVAPAALKTPNKLWFKLGSLMHKIVSPLVLGGIFFVTVTPTALIMRLLGKDPLRLRLDAEVESYWIHRDPPGPEPKSMSRQF